MLPWARRAYETCLSAGSTAELEPPPPRSCIELARLPGERIAAHALGAVKVASLTGFAQVISGLRGRRVGWTTPQEQTSRLPVWAVLWKFASVFA